MASIVASGGQESSSGGRGMRRGAGRQGEPRKRFSAAMRLSLCWEPLIRQPVAFSPSLSLSLLPIYRLFVVQPFALQGEQVFDFMLRL